MKPSSTRRRTIGSAARLFEVPRYHLMAIGFCAIPVMTLVWLPPQFLIGRAESWYVVPSLGCGLVALLTAMASLMEAWRSAGGRSPVSEPS